MKYLYEIPLAVVLVLILLMAAIIWTCFATVCWICLPSRDYDVMRPGTSIFAWSTYDPLDKELYKHYPKSKGSYYCYSTGFHMIWHLFFSLKGCKIGYNGRSIERPFWSPEYPLRTEEEFYKAINFHRAMGKTPAGKDSKKSYKCRLEVLRLWEIVSADEEERILQMLKSSDREAQKLSFLLIEEKENSAFEEVSP